MPLPQPQLTLEQVQTLVRGAFPQSKSGSTMLVEAIEPGLARIRMPYGNWMLRPGNVLSGPALMAAADTAMYVAVLSHVGPALMAVTADMGLRFLNKGVPGDPVAEARILKLGRKLVVMECRVWSAADPEKLVMHSTGSYALPG